MIDFNALRMRRVVPQNHVGAGVDQIVRKLAIVRINLILSVGRPVYRDQDVIDLWTQATNVLFRAPRTMWSFSSDRSQARRDGDFVA